MNKYFLAKHIDHTLNYFLLTLENDLIVALILISRGNSL